MQSVVNQTSSPSGFKGTSCACSISLAFPMLSVHILISLHFVSQCRRQYKYTDVDSVDRFTNSASIS